MRFHGDGTGRDGGFFEIVDVILVFIRTVVIADRTDEHIVLAVIDARGYVFPVVTVGAFRINHDGHSQIAGWRNSHYLAVIIHILVAMRPEITGRLTATRQTTDLFDHILVRRAAFGTSELVVQFQVRSVVIDAGGPNDHGGHKARHEK